MVTENQCGSIGEPSSVCVCDGSSEHSYLDTLAQLRKTDQKHLLSRARAKYLTQSLARGLASLGTSLSSSYWNTFHCASKLALYDDGTTSTEYCRNRWCLVCSRIRIAKCVNDYLPTLSSWPDRHFVTLTVPNVSADLLPDTIQDMFQTFKRIQEVARKRKAPLVGVRKLECTYNPLRNDYHPHFHVIIQNEEQANLLLSEWLSRQPLARPVAQDVRLATDGDLIELFKYFTKVLTRTPSSGSVNVYLDSLDVMFRSLRGRRVFQSFGFKLSDTETEDTETADSLTARVLLSQFDWFQSVHDWVNQDTGDLLTGYTPSSTFDALVKSINLPPS